jgi:hypothetical protein
MIALFGLPLPPSVNKAYVNRVTRKSSSNNSKLAFAISRRKSDEMTMFYAEVLRYRNQNIKAMQEITGTLQQWIDEGFVLAVDLTFAVFEPDMITKGKQVGRGDQKHWVGANVPHGTDSNNYIKAAIDGLTKLTDIDDKFILNGTWQKVTCESKDLECTIIVVRPTKIQNLNQIKTHIKNTLGKC